MEDSLKPGFDAVKAAKDYGIGLSTLYKILGQKEKFFSMVNQGKVTKKNVTTGKHVEIEEKLYKWCLEMNSRGVAIGGPMMRHKALEFANGDVNFKAGSGWLSNFMSMSMSMLMMKMT